MEFIGVHAVQVYEVDTAPFNDYARSGANCYGTPRKLTGKVMQFIMAQDKVFTCILHNANA